MIQKHKNIIFCIPTILILVTIITPYTIIPCQKESFNPPMNINPPETNIRLIMQHDKTEIIPFSPNTILNYPSSIFTLKKTGSITIRGFIYDKETQEPLIGATVFSYYAYSYAYPNLGLNISSTKTNETGFYTLHLPANQFFIIVARAPLYYTNYSFYNSTDNAAKDTMWINLSLRYGRVPESSHLRGYITEKNNTDNPISNATVMHLWMNGNEDTDLNFTRTNKTGYYECNVAYGFILAQIAFADGYLPFSSYSSNNSYGFWVDWNKTIWANISLQKIPKETSQIHGYITDQETGNAIADASILILWENEVGMNSENITCSDDDGYYQISVAAGTGTLHITHPDYYYKEFTNVSVNENMMKWINITLESINESQYKTYEYVWQQKTGKSVLGKHLFVGKKTPYDQSFTLISKPNSVLTHIEIQLNWTDDSKYGLLFKKGLDILSAEITLNGLTIDRESEGSGNFTFKFNVSNRPENGTITAESKSDAEEIIDEMIEGKNKADFDVLVTIETGERIWRLLKYLQDTGNEFEMRVSYIYYEYEIHEVDDQPY